MTSEPMSFHMPSLTELVQEYSNCWYGAPGFVGPPARETTTLDNFVSGSGDNVHDTYLDCTVAFAFEFEKALRAHIEERGL